jgi:hypothetical protein
MFSWYGFYYYYYYYYYYNIWMIKSRRTRWVEHVVSMEERRGAYKVWAVKPEEKRPLGRHRRR